MNMHFVPVWSGRLQGRKILITGNHDKCWKKLIGTRWHTHYLDAGFEEIATEMHMKIAGETVLLNHFQYRN